MPQSLAMLYVHVIFSTKGRVPCLNPSARQELYPYMAEVIRGMACLATRIGGTADHVHILCALSKDLSRSGFRGSS